MEINKIREVNMLDFRKSILGVAAIAMGFSIHAESSFFAAVGVSKRALPAELVEVSKQADWQRKSEDKAKLTEFHKMAGENSLESMVKEAADEMMSKFKSAGKTPKALLFVERIPGVTTFTVPDAGAKIAKTLMASAGDVPVFGTGGAQSYGIAWGAEIKSEEPSFIVMGLTGSDLDVKGYVDGGKLDYIYNDKKTSDDAAAGDGKAKEKIDKEKSLREMYLKKGEDFARKIPKMEKPGFVLFMGAIHNNWHCTFAEGMAKGLSKGTVMIGGVGQWDDYVYCNGEKFDGSPVGRIAITIQGSDFDLAIFGSSAEKVKYSREGLQKHNAEVCGKIIEGLGGKKPDAVIALSCVTRMRDSKIMDPAVMYEDVVKELGENVILFGNFCGGEIYLDKDGMLDSGGDRLVIAGFKGKTK